MESWENYLNQEISNPNQASQAGFSGNNTWLRRLNEFQVSFHNKLTVHHCRSCPFGWWSP
jgi:hypothetical protein